MEWAEVRNGEEMLEAVITATTPLSPLGLSVSPWFVLFEKEKAEGSCVQHIPLLQRCLREPSAHRHLSSSFCGFWQGKMQAGGIKEDFDSECQN